LQSLFPSLQEDSDQLHELRSHQQQEEFVIQSCNMCFFESKGGNQSKY